MIVGHRLAKVGSGASSSHHVLWLVWHCYGFPILWSRMPSAERGYLTLLLSLAKRYVPIAGYDDGPQAGQSVLLELPDRQLTYA